MHAKYLELEDVLIFFQGHMSTIQGRSNPVHSFRMCVQSHSCILAMLHNLNLKKVGPQFLMVLVCFVGIMSMVYSPPLFPLAQNI